MVWAGDVDGVWRRWAGNCPGVTPLFFPKRSLQQHMNALHTYSVRHPHHLQHTPALLLDTIAILPPPP